MCDAIDAVVARWATRDPGAFSHRDSDLGGAVARDLYITLVNDNALLELFAAARAGEGTGRRRSPGPLEADVAARMTGADCRVTWFTRARARRLAAAVARGARVRRSRSTLRSGRSTGSPVCFVAHNAKFMRFVRPLVDAFDADAIVLSDDELSADHTAAAVTRRLLHVPQSRPSAAGLADRPHLAHQYDRYHATLAELAPRALVLVEGNHPHDEVAARAAGALDIPTACIQHGWSPIVHSGFRNLSFDRMLVWGQGFVDLLQPHSPQQRFAVTGDHALEQHDGAAASDLDRILAGRPAVGFYFQMTSQLITRGHIGAIVELALRVARARPNAVVLVREHPSWPLFEPDEKRLASLPNVVRVPPSEFPLATIVRATVATVSIYSTTLVESVALGVPSVIVNPTALPRYSPDLGAMGAGVEVQDPEAADEVILRLLDDEQYRATFDRGLDRVRLAYFGGGGESLKSVLGELETLRRP